ncbi:MAG: glycosyltransferase [Spirochaetes bacterium]|nr:glycosyltransferase [Spirochaetota bacterium]
MSKFITFKEEVELKLNSFLKEQIGRFPGDETITIDLHCHDHNSNVPDELLARILNVPETWLQSEELIRVLRSRGCDAFTVTNHNNTRSCYELIEKGEDILVGAEWSCMVPDYKIGIHVLAYGFTPEQEKKLNKLRTDIYKFQEYTKENDIPTIWAHPLYHYKSTGLPPMEFFDKMSLLFERFEVINGQRDSWQNMLVKVWIESLTREKIGSLSKAFRIPADKYVRDPYLKAMAGGSDSHMGIFTGLTGSKLYVPGLKEITDKKKSELALRAIKAGRIAPFGSHNDTEKMAVTFLDYFCQIGMNMKDPGLLRMLLHKGESKDKFIAFAAANGFMELKRHKTTFNFLKVFKDCFAGNVPGRVKRFIVSKDYREVFKLASNMAAIRRNDPEKSIAAFDLSIYKIFEILNRLLVSRAEKKVEKLNHEHDLSSLKIEEIISGIELPSHFRALFDEDRIPKANRLRSINISKFLDGLSFPFLASAVILASFYTSARVMYKSRQLLDEFADAYGTLRHPERTLWITDTFEDSNGVAMVLKSMLAEIRRRNLPIDILAASSSLESGDHFISVKPVSEFTLPFYKQQPVRIPNLLEIHKLFKEGEYNRIICSTEGPMGMAAVYLKYAYSVPAYFYVHTDWMMFSDKVLRLNDENKSRLRRMLRAFYRQFDGLFVLNRDQQNWLTGRDMGFDPAKVFLTAHWADDGFSPMTTDKQRIFGINGNETVILFAGRISDEKGVMEIPLIMEKVRRMYPDAKIAFAGKGPRENDLKDAMPDAIYLGWVDHEKLPEIYSAADLLILPSRFDTFGCVVLEALSCGLPVIAYNTKGPKDIIISGLNGYLAKNRSDMAEKIIEFLGNKNLRKKFRNESLKRAKEYDPDRIISQFMQDLLRAA